MFNDWIFKQKVLIDSSFNQMSSNGRLINLIVKNTSILSIYTYVLIVSNTFTLGCILNWRIKGLKLLGCKRYFEINFFLNINKTDQRSQVENIIRISRPLQQHTLYK